MLGWSIEQLSTRARQALGALTLFDGPFDLDAATAVLATVPGATPRQHLAELLDHSLVQRTPTPGVITYTMLQPIRRALSTTELGPRASPGAHQAHARHFLRLVNLDVDGSTAESQRLPGNLLLAVQWAWDNERDLLGPALAYVLRLWDVHGWRTQVLHCACRASDSALRATTSDSRPGRWRTPALTPHVGAVPQGAWRVYRSDFSRNRRCAMSSGGYSWYGSHSRNPSDWYIARASAFW